MSEIIRKFCWDQHKVCLMIFFNETQTTVKILEHTTTHLYTYYQLTKLRNDDRKYFKILLSLDYYASS